MAYAQVTTSAKIDCNVELAIVRGYVFIIIMTVTYIDILTNNNNFTFIVPN